MGIRVLSPFSIMVALAASVAIYGKSHSDWPPDGAVRGRRDVADVPRREPSPSLSSSPYAFPPPVPLSEGWPLGATDRSQAASDALGPILGAWVAPSPAPEPGPPALPAAPALRAEPEAPCPEGMVLVQGPYCPFVAQRCLQALPGPVDRCAEYAPDPSCEGRAQEKRFCIDRYEYPNLQGVRPAVMVSWLEAKATCQAEGKRLCTGSEWTFACEGSQKLPYPYGYVRDATACNIDQDHPEPDLAAFGQPRSIAAEVARLDRRVPSGQMARCESPFGVFDMTGNVDEWVVNERHFDARSGEGERPNVSGLKGGYWGPVRDRCRPITTFHNEWFRYYEVGFRCCADPAAGGPARP